MYVGSGEGCSGGEETREPDTLVIGCVSNLKAQGSEWCPIPSLF